MEFGFLHGGHGVIVFGRVRPHNAASHESHDVHATARSGRLIDDLKLAHFDAGLAPGFAKLDRLLSVAAAIAIGAGSTCHRAVAAIGVAMHLHITK